MIRNHHLRERRLKLGASQFLIGCLAGWPPYSAQSMVSHVERGSASASAPSVRKVRSALVWLEAQPRRKREWARQDAITAAHVDAVLFDQTNEWNAILITERLTDLLLEGRTDEYDTLAERVLPELVDVAADQYLELNNPNLPENQYVKA